MPPGYRWRIWIRDEHGRAWLEPVVAGPGAIPSRMRIDCTAASTPIAVIAFVFKAIFES